MAFLAWLPAVGISMSARDMSQLDAPSMGTASGPERVLYFHLHKAAGTTACSTFRACGVLEVYHSGYYNCNCWKYPEGEAEALSEPRRLSAGMMEHDLGACFIEHAQSWPSTAAHAQLAEHLRLAVSLRNPWDRFWSNYQHDWDQCNQTSNGLYGAGTLEEYLDGSARCRPSADGATQEHDLFYKGGFGVVLPNFYVRALTGKAHADESVDSADLAAVQASIAQNFDSLNILELESFTPRLWALAGCDPSQPAVQANDGTQFDIPEAVLAQKDNETFRRIWDEANALDLELYDWAVSRTEAEDASPIVTYAADATTAGTVTSANTESEAKVPTTSGSCCATCAARGATSYRIWWVGINDDARCVCGHSSEVDATSLRWVDEHATSDCSRDEIPKRFVLGVTTGHAASATLSNHENAGRNLSTSGCYTHEDEAAAPIVWNFEASHIYLDTNFLEHKRGLKKWYADAAKDEAAATASDLSSVATLLPAARTLADSSLVNDMLVYTRRILQKTAMELPETVAGVKESTYVDLGHHFNLGLFDPVVEALSSIKDAHGQPATTISVVRIIRNRYDTARSFMSENKTPCGALANGTKNGMFTMCPEIHPVELVPPPKVWEALDSYQRVLWFIDEVEARWQRTLERFPDLDVLTISWCDTADYDAARDTVADFIGGPTLQPAECGYHTHTSDSDDLDTDEELAVKDAAYQSSMGYGSAMRARLVQVQQSSICASK